MDDTMDNQHIEQTGLAYLAGAIDGEGTITLDRAGKRRSDGQMGVTPTIYVTNTNDAFINRCQQILESNGISSYVKTQARGSHKTCYWIVVKGMTKVKILLNLLSPYLVAKTGQASLVVRFIESRLGDGSVHPRNTLYQPEDYRLINNVRALNSRSMTQTEDTTASNS